MPSRPSSDLPTSLDSLREALAAGRRQFPGLRLGDLDGVALDLADCDLHGGCFKEARFGRARLARANVEGACLPAGPALGRRPLGSLAAAGSFWHDADLSGARLQGADFGEALMHRCCLRGVLGAGSRWRGTRLVEADFRSGLDQRTDLGGADFQGADLSFALMQGAQLQGSDLRGACLYGTNMVAADLRAADLRGCDLRDTDLRDAMLEGTRLTDALLP